MALALPQLVRDYAEIDLTRMGVDSRITFTRASTRTYFDASGVLRTAAINEWPLEYDPATGACLGRSTWLQRSNLLTYSGIETGVAGMLASNVSNASIAWLGALSAGVSFVDNTVFRYAYRTDFSNQIGIVYTLSMFVRMDDGGVPVFGGTGPTHDAALVIGGQLATSVTAQHVGGGIYRLSSSRSHTAADSSNGVIKYMGNSARGFKVSGFQLEAGSHSSPYIPTTTVSLTRSADTASAPLSSLRHNAASGAILVEHAVPSGAPLISSGGGAILTSQGAGKTAIRWTPSASYVSHNGTAEVAGPALTWGANLDIGALGTARANGTFKRIRVYPSARDAQKLTA